MHALVPSARFAPGFCTLVVLAGVWVGEAGWFWALVPLAAIGAAAGRHPIDIVYNEVLAPILGQPALRSCGASKRFSFTVAMLWLMAIALAFSDGPTLVGGMLAGLMAGLSFATAAFDFCLPCFAWSKLIDPPKRRLRIEEQETLPLSGLRRP